MLVLHSGSATDADGEGKKILLRSDISDIVDAMMERVQSLMAPLSIKASTP